MRKNSLALNCHTMEGGTKETLFFYIIIIFYYFHSVAQQILCRFGLARTNWSPNSSSSLFVIKRGKRRRE